MVDTTWSNFSEGNLALQGSLGSLSLSDLTPHGDLYRERFTTQGGEALIFNILKYALQTFSRENYCHIALTCRLGELVSYLLLSIQIWPT